jgi:hypothetical protein
VLPVEAGNEHGAIVLIAPWLIGGQERRFTALGCHISQPLAEAAVTKLGRTTEKFKGIVGAKGRDTSLHGAVVFIAERQDVGPHGLSLAFAANASPRRTNKAKSGDSKPVTRLFLLWLRRFRLLHDDGFGNTVMHAAAVVMDKVSQEAEAAFEHRGPIP